MTRAEEQLVLVGRHADDGGVDDGDLSLSFIDSWLPEQIPWRATGASFPIWQEVTTGLPSEATDWTDEVAPTDGGLDPAISVNGEPLSQSAARDRVLELARGLLNGDLDSVSPAIAGFAVEALSTDGGPAFESPAQLYFAREVQPVFPATLSRLSCSCVRGPPSEVPPVLTPCRFGTWVSSSTILLR